MRNQRQRRSAAHPHPPGFKEVTGLVSKFSGKQAEDGTFEVWLKDFEEATTDCGWSDKMRARWFSWFVSDPAKATWQRSLTIEQKADWKSIVKVFHRQYGVHLDLVLPTRGAMSFVTLRSIWISTRSAELNA